MHSMQAGNNHSDGKYTNFLDLKNRYSKFFWISCGLTAVQTVCSVSFKRHSKLRQLELSQYSSYNTRVFSAQYSSILGSILEYFGLNTERILQKGESETMEMAIRHLGDYKKILKLRRWNGIVSTITCQNEKKLVNLHGTNKHGVTEQYKPQTVETNIKL